MPRGAAFDISLSILMVIGVRLLIECAHVCTRMYAGVSKSVNVRTYARTCTYSTSMIVDHAHGDSYCFIIRKSSARMFSLFD